MSDTSVTGPPGLSACGHLWGPCWAFARMSISQTVERPENSHAQLTLYQCQDGYVFKHLLHSSSSWSSCLFPPSFSTPLPPSSSPPALHLLRSSVKILAFVSSKKRDCDFARVVYVRLHPKPETRGVFKPAGPPISPPSHHVTAPTWGPSAECLCVFLSNPHKDPLLFHKFI